MASNNKRRVALGKALVATDAELDALTTYSAADIQRAIDDWQANAPTRARGLVDAAEAVDDTGPPA